MAVTVLFADIRNQMTLVSDDIGTHVRSSTILTLENNNLIFKESVRKLIMKKKLKMVMWIHQYT